ncbi:MAG: DUF4391 domain-containing protein [Bifidobacterium tibiigranuli]|jgi:hypothetical protein|uniref:DUF4391 domain-containing protein n=1 Tax=Bifidobacterium tibiigranuli TaxID=2172043 RepID=UPI0026EC4924|nr:DUF4391 domain-containing protein [Bifidobacterium tibiigranuli]MCI1672619.1 DUF4391 domain-containing protein [Bifidobacterium tibiigranuli]MCI1712376.1 DUF4391 domain-containing protein [Bifidobacterium tibiigranuli]MCI1833366.1 DUF4391 domain-containing protein [Bifidobacterium tibiigranuli]
MTVAHCGSVSALSLGLPASCAIPEAKGTLPKQMFTARTPVSAKLKQRFANDVEDITMLALLRPNTIGVAAAPEGRGPAEVMVIGIQHRGANAPVEVIEHIAGMRRSGIVFVCVSDEVPAEAQESQPQESQSDGSGDHESQSTAPRSEFCAFAVQRAMPGKAGRPRTNRVFVSDYQPSSKAKLAIAGTTLDEVWESLSAQIILGSADAHDLDARIANRDNLASLRADEAKLVKDHARAKRPAQRNELYAKLHKLRAEISRLEAE